jgi:ATPase subunit of ABC transporter with duplicated ATPase domains
MCPSYSTACELCRRKRVRDSPTAPAPRVPVARQNSWVISCSDITIEIGGRTLIRDGAFSMARADKVGLVGRNGAGKSSLISFIFGEAPAHIRATGTIRVEGTMGYLPQLPADKGLGIDPTALSHVLSARGLDVLDDRLTRARRALAASPTEEAIGEFTSLEEQYGNAGGYEVESHIGRLADGLGIPQSLLFEDITSLSGGERRRVDLMRVLFQAPDTLVLDEPTNHLDLAAKKWLMNELGSLRGGLLMVSHDLRLLDAAITKVVNLSGGRLRQYSGTYSSFRSQLAGEISQRERSFALEGAKIDKMRAQADKWRHSTEAQARKAKILDRQVTKMQGRRTEVIKRERKVAFHLPDPVRSGADALLVRQLGVAYGRHEVLSCIDFSVVRGDRVVVIGRNGAGKSSLLRCLAEVQKPTSGTVTIGYRVAVGYFAQEHEQIDSNRSVLENIDDTVLTKEPDRRKLLGSFGLTGETAAQSPNSLSGGERARLSLAMLAAGKANLLVLDEPTNNLDPVSVEAVGAMLSRWKGTIVAVSHDRPFVEALVPTHALHLPDERYTLWREEYLDDVELR